MPNPTRISDRKSVEAARNRDVETTSESRRGLRSEVVRRFEVRKCLPRGLTILVEGEVVCLVAVCLAVVDVAFRVAVVVVVAFRDEVVGVAVGDGHVIVVRCGKCWNRFQKHVFFK